MQSNNTKLNTVQLAKAIERAIYDILVRESFTPPIANIEVERSMMFRIVELAFDNETITAGFFNTIISDMKRAGLITTARGGDVLFLSETSLKLEASKRKGQADGGAK